MTGEILTTAEMTKADAFAVAHGVPSLTLMENAGRAVTDAIVARFKPCAVTVLCGPGNNGGDGFVVAHLLKQHWFRVRVAHDGGHKGDAAAMAAIWDGETVALTPAALDGAALVVDALFGAGLSRPLEGAVAQIVEILNDLPVVAIDVPSGFVRRYRAAAGRCPCDGGADRHFLSQEARPSADSGRLLCGELVVADIGIPPEAAGTQLHENTPALWHFPWPKAQGHKYDRGHCVVVCGPAHATAPARLAARGALRMGAGLVSVAAPPDAVAVNAAHLTAIMIMPFEGADGLAHLLADKRLNAVAIGPGLGVSGETRALVDVVLKSGAAVVLDADALTSFRDDPEALFNRLHDRCVLTPHDGEFERLFPGLLDEAASKVEAVRTAAARAGCTVLLKGSDTVIAEASGKAAINANAPATLATAGAGDVLAGFIAGLLAQKLAAFEAACAGAWLHGAAAAAFGLGLIAEDLPEILPKLLTELRHD